MLSTDDSIPANPLNDQKPFHPWPGENLKMKIANDLCDSKGPFDSIRWSTVAARFQIVNIFLPAWDEGDAPSAKDAAS